MAYWLMKSEPTTFSITALQSAPKQTTHWEGVRNYQARNLMRDDMRQGDLAFFYHSNCDIPGIVGIVKITREAYPDDSAYDPNSHYYDPKSTPENPRWFMVDITLVEIFDRIIPLSDLKQNEKLKDWALLRKGNRLSVLPVSDEEWQEALK